MINILELPELSIGLFGSDKSYDHCQTNDEIKTYCSDNKFVPHIIDFFMKRNSPSAK